MAIFVMTKTSDGCPAGFFEYKDHNDGEYLWAFHGYVKMQSTNAADAEQELLDRRDEFWRACLAASDDCRTR